MPTKHTVTKAYNDDWQKKAKDPGRFHYQKRVFETFNNLYERIIKVPLEGNLLDLGCGDGSVVEVLNQQPGIQATGIDINQGIDFEADSLPYKDNTFDIALMYSVIEHICNPGNILTEARRVLRKAGHLVIITPNYDLKNLLICDRSFYDDPTHIHPYSPKSLLYLMRLYHFKKRFLGLWTVKKSAWLWKLPLNVQLYIGALLPFRGDYRFSPSFLRGKSRTILGVFENDK